LMKIGKIGDKVILIVEEADIGTKPKSLKASPIDVLIAPKTFLLDEYLKTCLYPCVEAVKGQMILL